jgi:hypothetical protein
MIVFMRRNSSSAPTTVPTGWTLKIGKSASWYNYIYWKVATSADVAASSFGNWVWSGSANGTTICFAFSGTFTNPAPIRSVTTYYSTTASGTSNYVPALVTTQDDSYVLALTAGTAASTFGFNLPTGSAFTELYDVWDSSTQGMAAAWQRVSAVGTEVPFWYYDTTANATYKASVMLELNTSIAAPSPDTSFYGTKSGSNVVLTWTKGANSTGHKIYRSATYPFTPSAGNLIATVGDVATYTTPAQDTGRVWYYAIIGTLSGAADSAATYAAVPVSAATVTPSAWRHSYVTAPMWSNGLSRNKTADGYYWGSLSYGHAAFNEPYNSGKFRIMKSIDGITWTEQTLTQLPDGFMATTVGTTNTGACILYGATGFAAAGVNQIWRSTDNLATWTLLHEWTKDVGYQGYQGTSPMQYVEGLGWTLTSILYIDVGTGYGIPSLLYSTDDFTTFSVMQVAPDTSTVLSDPDVGSQTFSTVKPSECGYAFHPDGQLGVMHIRHEGQWTQNGNPSSPAYTPFENGFDNTGEPAGLLQWVTTNGGATWTYCGRARDLGNNFAPIYFPVGGDMVYASGRFWSLSSDRRYSYKLSGGLDTDPRAGKCSAWLYSIGAEELRANPTTARWRLEMEVIRPVYTTTNYLAGMPTFGMKSYGKFLMAITEESTTDNDVWIADVDMALSEPPSNVVVDYNSGANKVTVTFSDMSSSEDGIKYKVAYDGGAYGSVTTIATPNTTSFQFTPSGSWNSITVAVQSYNSLNDSDWVSGTYSSATALNASAVGKGSASASLGVLVPFSAGSVGSASVNAQAQFVRALTSISAGVAQAQAELKAVISKLAESHGGSVSSAALTPIMASTTESRGGSAVAAGFVAAFSMAAESHGGSASSASLIRVASAAAEAHGQSEAQAALGTLLNAVASSHGEAVTGAALELILSKAASSVGSATVLSSAANSFVIEFAASALGAAIATSSPQIRVAQPLNASAQGLSVVDAVASAVVEFITGSAGEGVISATTEFIYPPIVWRMADRREGAWSVTPSAGSADWTDSSKRECVWKPVAVGVSVGWNTVSKTKSEWNVPDGRD